MKKILSILICLPLIFISCKKEENKPNNTTNNNSVTVLPPSQTLPFDLLTSFGDTVIDSNGDSSTRSLGYEIIKAEFEINCSELTNLSNDISYAFITEGNNYIVTNSSAGYLPADWGNGLFKLYHPDEYFIYLPDSNGIHVPGKGSIFTTVYPKNSNNKPAHSVFQQEKWIFMHIVEYYYSPGVLTLYLLKDQCPGGDPNGWEIDPNYPDYWVVDMVVTEYSDGKIKLTIDQGPFTSSEGIIWGSFLELTLEKNF